MNTQTHILLACAVLVPATTSQLRNRSYPGAIALVLVALAGALFPDASIFVMWGIAKSQGIAESVIWGEWYFSARWQLVGAMTNSFPIYMTIAAVAWLAGGRYWISGSAIAANAAATPIRENLRASHLALVFASAAILHVLTDLPLHHDDGHPHFWPLTSWIFRSPVSYWDPAHYGRLWSVTEVVLALILITVLWRRFDNRAARVLLLLAATSYLIVTGYWFLAF